MSEPAAASIRVLVADDQGLIREGIASLLALQPGIVVAGTAANGAEALELALAAAPDVVLMDVRMPVMDGIEATAALARQAPRCQVLMLTTFDDEEYIVKALRAGARGYLLKDIPAAELAQAIHLAHAGIYQLDPLAAGKLVGALGRLDVPLSSTPSPASFDGLTERELAVLRLLARGATNREIAAELLISEGTVKSHVSNILSRLGLRDRVQAAIYARDRNLI
jgi:DNA-binding NarL/FixJ family response regulator